MAALPLLMLLMQGWSGRHPDGPCSRFLITSSAVEG